jgi:hypothetical protein
MTPEPGQDTGRAMKVAVFSTKPYDREYLDRGNAGHGHELTFFDAHLGRETAILATGHGAVCAFVNDVLDSEVLRQLAAVCWRSIPSPTRAVPVKVSGHDAGSESPGPASLDQGPAGSAVAGSAVAGSAVAGSAVADSASAGLTLVVAPGCARMSSKNCCRRSSNASASATMSGRRCRGSPPWRF